MKDTQKDLSSDDVPDVGAAWATEIEKRIAEVESANSKLQRGKRPDHESRQHSLSRNMLLV